MLSWNDRGQLQNHLKKIKESMTENDQKELGNTLWKIADDLRGSMNADDFRDYMLSFLFLRYLSDNYEAAAKKELGGDYPALAPTDKRAPLARPQSTFPIPNTIPTQDLDFFSASFWVRVVICIA